MESHPALDPCMRTFLHNVKKESLDYFLPTKKYLFDMLDFKNRRTHSYAYHWSLEDYSSAIYSSEYYIEKIFEPKPLRIAQEENKE